MFGYPYGFSGYTPSDEYARALAEERAARTQYAAAVRAQEEAQRRAASARLAQQQAYASPYDVLSPYASYLPNDYDDVDLPEGSFLPHSGFGFGLSPQQRRAMLEEQRRRELLQAEREREIARKTVEEEAERQRMVDAEAFRQRVLEEKRRAQEEVLRTQLIEQRRREQQEAEERESELERFYRDFGLRMPRFEHTEIPNRRARTSSPVHRTPVPLHFHSPTPTQTQIPSHSTTHVRIPVDQQHQSPKASPKPASPKLHEQVPTSPPRAKSPPKSQPSLEDIEAATKIQQFYRAQNSRRRALETIEDLKDRFQSLSSSFNLPSTVEFNSNGSRVVVNTSSLLLPSIAKEEGSTPVPSLSYSPINVPLHQYYEQLNQLLNQLDAVESGGDKNVREKRRSLARSVENEAERIDRWKVAIWKTAEKNASEASTTESSLVVPPREEHMEAESTFPHPELVVEASSEDRTISEPLSPSSEEPVLEPTNPAEESEVDEATLTTPEEVSKQLPQDSTPEGESFEKKSESGEGVKGKDTHTPPLMDRDWRLMDDLMFF